METRKIREGTEIEEKEIVKQKERIKNAKNVIYTTVRINSEKNIRRAVATIRIEKTEMDMYPFIFSENEEGKMFFSEVRDIDYFPSENEDTKDDVTHYFLTLAEARAWVDEMEKSVINLWAKMKERELFQRNELCDGYTFVEF